MPIIAVFYTSLALLAFAGNSVLCRLALHHLQMDAGSFTGIRLIAGAITLLLLVSLFNLRQLPRHDKPLSHQLRSAGSWSAACMLFVYAIAFSYAYITLDTGTGALILFAAVQITMLVVNALRGNRLLMMEWMGLLLAMLGLVYLLLPTLSIPTLTGFVLMLMAGMAWAFYTFAGQGSTQPLLATTSNFLRTLPIAIPMLLVGLGQSDMPMEGVLLAVLSGAMASGVGYTLWYLALRHLTTVLAAVVQLMVPIVAALFGILFADEMLTQTLAVASVLIVGGLLLVLMAKTTKPLAEIKDK
ncbi:DMT family transporter [Alteromonadaceae bacterium BrNp21-10]|nr:DMT family transporter [Alteromonadaceae bacterium BrNp21-10]